MKRPTLEILESEDIRKIVAAAYDLLENFGVMVDNEEALGILEDSGARVDVKEKVAYIPGGMVDKALETRPSGFTIYDQECKRPAILENDNIHFCPGKAEVTERLETFTPVSLPEDKIKEIMRIMKSYARSKGVDELPQVDGWLG